MAQLAAHSHPYEYPNIKTNSVVGFGAYGDHSSTNTGATGGSKSHTHTLSGASGQASSLPPYYALAYIMRVA